MDYSIIQKEFSEQINLTNMSESDKLTAKTILLEALIVSLKNEQKQLLKKIMS